MHSIRSLLLVSSAILGFAVLAPPAAAASFVPFTVTKTCPASLNPGGIPGVCLISASSIAALGGAKIYYYGPLPNNVHVSQQQGGARNNRRRHSVRLLQCLSSRRADRRNLRVP